jgi:hypothetical protein
MLRAFSSLRRHRPSRHLSVVALLVVALVSGVAPYPPSSSTGGGGAPPVEGAASLGVSIVIDDEPPTVGAASAVVMGNVRRAATGDVTSAAVDISKATFPNGSAAYALLGRDDVFADSLAGAALAGTRGPLLFTAGGPDRPLRAEVLTELTRVLPRDGCPTVYLLGGVAAVSAAVERSVRSAGFCPERIAGESRVETSVAIADVVARRTGTPHVLLARADRWPDAATGGAYAAVAGTPILVTPTDRLHPAVAAFLAARRPGRVSLLGGEAALTEGVRRSAASHTTRIDRIAGVARDHTAAAIAAQLWQPRSPKGAVLVNGYTDRGWAYALAGGVLAARAEAVVLYVEANSVTPGARVWLAPNPPRFTVALGPPTAIADSVHAQVIAGVTAPPPSPAPAPAPAIPPAPARDLYGWLSVLPGTDEPLRWNPCEPIRWVFNPRHAPGHALADVQQALSRVATASGLEFRYLGTVTDRPTRQGGTTRGRGDDPRYPGEWMPLLISFAHPDEVPALAGHVAGIGGATARGTSLATLRYISGEVVIDAGWAAGAPGGFGRASALGPVLMHEMGHAVGMGHARGAGQVLSPVMSMTTWGAGDRYALARLGRASGCMAPLTVR